ncbi:MAG: hypothetical protein ACLFQE_07220, partial [Thermotogota bacterium]
IFFIADIITDISYFNSFTNLVQFVLISFGFTLTSLAIMMPILKNVQKNLTKSNEKKIFTEIINEFSQGIKLLILILILLILYSGLSNTINQSNCFGVIDSMVKSIFIGFTLVILIDYMDSIFILLSKKIDIEN